jgi:hypothetical protein
MLGRFLLITWHTWLEYARPPFASRLADQHLFLMASHTIDEDMLSTLYQKSMSKHTSGEDTLGRFLLITCRTLLECARPPLASRSAAQHLFRMTNHKNTLHSDSAQDFHKPFTRFKGDRTMEDCFLEASITEAIFLQYQW